MAFVRIGGNGLWMPMCPLGVGFNGAMTASDTLLLDADEEEAQMIGRVMLAAGTGSKTFGTSGSAVSWFPGASITFADDGTDDPTLTVGVKACDLTAGPPARATIGAAAFAVSKGLVGGTDTITSTTWRTDSMSAGTPFTVTHGDLLAVCWHLNKPGSAAQSIKVRTALSPASSATNNFPTNTLVTSGPTYAAGSLYNNCVLTFDDTTLGWLDDCFVSSNILGSEAVGNTNLYGNIITPVFDCKVDAIRMYFGDAGTTNFDVGLWSDPTGTPTAMTGGTLSVDPQVIGVAGSRIGTFLLPAEVELAAGTPYFYGLKQNSATGLTVYWDDVAATTHHQINGLDANCYAVKSTAGAAVAAQNSSLRRARMWLRVSSVHDGAGGSGGNANILRGSVVA